MRSRAASPKDRAALLPAALIVIGAIAYANSLSGAFLFDDYSCIHENPQVHHLWPWAHGVQARREIALAGRPVPILLTAFNYALGGLDPFSYHVVNVALHLLNALLLFGIIRRTLLTKRCAAAYGRHAARLAVASAALWMVHPLATEGVDYIIQRTELLMACGLLGALYSVIRAAQDPARQRRWHLTAVIACALGMASKEVMAVAPFVVLLYDRVFLSASWRELWRRRVRLYGMLASTWLILAWLLMSHPRVITAGFAVPEVTPWRYALTQTKVLLRYLRLSVWPSPLVADYGDWPLVTSWREALPSAAVVLALLGAAIWSLRRWSAIGFLGAWFFLVLAPTSSLVPIVTELAAERRMYLPLCALTTGAVIGGWRWLTDVVKPEQRRMRLAATLWIALVIGASALTIRRHTDYQSELSILRDVIRKRPANGRAHYNLGIVLGELGRYAESEAAFRAAIRLEPGNGQPHNNLGVVLERMRRWDEAAKEYAVALRLGPERPETHVNVGASLLRQGRKEEAVQHFQKALQIDPTNRRAREYLARSVTQHQQP